MRQKDYMNRWDILTLTESELSEAREILKPENSPDLLERTEKQEKNPKVERSGTRPSVVVVAPAGASGYQPGLHYGVGHRTVLVSTDLRVSLENVSELYLHIGDGGLSSREAEVMVRELRHYTPKAKIGFVTGDDCQFLDEIVDSSGREWVPLVIAPFEQIVPGVMGTITGSVLLGREYEQIITENKFGRYV